MRRWLILLIPLMVWATNGARAQADGPTDRAELEAFMDGAVLALLASEQVPGATVSVVKDGEILLAKGYGYADVEGRVPVDPARSLFRIASTSKLFAWTAVMQLWEQGRLDLDADINRYLDFEIPASFPEPITLKHLMTHTAGFEDRYRGLFGQGPEDLGPLGEILANNLPARVMPPGQESAYSNYGAALAGYIVERVSGLPFEQYVEENLYAPLGMTHSSFRQPVPPALAPELATGYTYVDGAFEAQAFEYDPAIADGAMSSSAVDMAHFMLAHLQDGRFGAQRILQQETAREMHRRIFGHDPRIAGMAYGFYEIDLNGQRAIGHGGDLFYFHTDLLLWPEHDLGLFVSFNSDTGSRARDKIVPLFLDRYFPASPAALPAPPADFAARVEGFTGAYRINRHAYETLEKVMLLALGDMRVRGVDSNGLLLDFAGEPMRMLAVGPRLFRVVGGDLALGTELIAFREDAAGDITHVLPTPVLTLYRLAWYETARFHRGLLALCLAIFLITAIRGIRRLCAPAPGVPRLRGRDGLILAVSLLNLVFAVGFGIAVLPALETAMIPEGVVYLLVLPVISAAPTAGLLLGLVQRWMRRDGTLRDRSFASVFGLAALGYLWSLHYWNLLGWRW